MVAAAALLAVGGLAIWKLMAGGAPATTLEATLVDTIDDTNGTMAGVAEPGETIDYTATVTNTGPGAAIGVTYNTTVDANTTLIPASVRVSPLANDDAYACIGNVGLTVPAGSGVLANDTDPDGALPANAVTSTGAIATANGSVMMAADGSFTYAPNAGFNGVDSFTYTIADSHGLADASTGSGIVSVEITVGGRIWFIDPSAPGGGTGTLASPFNGLAQHNANSNDADGDCIFVYSGSLGGGIVLQNDQVLVGAGSSLSLAVSCGITAPAHTALPATGGTRPVLSNTGGNGINLASGNTVRGLNVGNTAVASDGIAGGGVGSLTIDEVAILGTGGGVNLSNGVLGVTLDSVTSSGSDTGIFLRDTTGSFTVTGDGTNNMNGSGGTITASGSGVDIQRATGVTLASMNVNNCGNSGLFFGALGPNGVTDVALRGLSVSGNGNAVNENNIEMINVVGAITIQDCRVTQGAEHNIVIENQTGTINSLTVTGNEVDNAATAVAFGHGIRVSTLSTGGANANITSSTFADNNIHDNGSTGVFIIGNGGGTINTIVGQSSGATNNALTSNNIHIDFSTGTMGGNKDAILTDNTLTTSNSHGVNLFHAAGAGGGSGFYNAEVTDNAITGVGDVAGSFGGTGVRSAKNDQVDAALLIDNNVIRIVAQGFNGGRGIELGADGSGGTTDVHVTNNDVNLSLDPDDAALEALNITTQNGHNFTCDVTNNTLIGDPGFGFPIDVSIQSNGAVLEVEDQAAASANVVAEILSTNTTQGAGSSVTTFAGTPTLVPAGSTQDP